MDKPDDKTSHPPRKPAGYLTAIAVSLAGLLVVLGAADVIHADPESFHAPRWVVGLCGMLFVLAGAIIGFSNYPRIRLFLTALLLLAFASVAAWVSLMTDPEGWSGGAGFFSTSANGMIAKALAGLGALVLYYAFLQVTARLIRGNFKDDRKR